MENYIDFKTLLSRLKFILNLSKDVEISEALHLTYQSFAQMKRRNTLPYANLLLLCEEQEVDPFIILNKNDDDFQAYCDDKLKTKNTIKIINSANTLSIPNLNIADSFQAYIEDNGDINIIDTKYQTFKHNQSYIIQQNGIYYNKHFYIDQDNNYIFTEPNVDDWILSKDKVKDIKCIGKIIYSYLFTQNRRSKDYTISADFQRNLSDLISCAMKNKLS